MFSPTKRPNTVGAQRVSKGVKGCQRLSVDNHDGAASFSEANQRKDKGRKLKREMNGDNSEAAETSS
jgi:hypothetical protein